MTPMQALMELLTPVMNNLKVAGAKGEPTQTETGGNPFRSLLGQIMKQNQLQDAAGGGDGGAVTGLGLSDLLSALIGKDMGAFLQTLQTAAGQAEAGCSTKQSATGAGDVTAKAAGGKAAGGADLDRGTQVESLLTGLLALVAMKMAKGGTTDGTAAGSDPADQNMLAAALNSLVSSLSAAGKEKGAQPGGTGASSAPTKDDASKTDNVTLVEALALLIFESLQTVAATQDQAPSGVDHGLDVLLGKGDPEGAGALPSVQGKGSGGEAAVNKASKEALKTIEDGQAASDTGVQQAPEVDAKDPGSYLLAAAGDRTDPSSQEKTVGQTLISVASVGQASETNNLTLVIKGPFNGGVQNQEPGGKSGTESLLANEAANGAGAGLKDDASMVIVKDLTALITGQEGNPSRGSGSDRGGSTDAQAYPLTTDKDVSPGSAATQDANGTAPLQAGSTGAVERFEQIVGQLGARPASHDLLVRLNFGNEESLVLGLKDLGQSVTVEVRASNQGMINLLESQRDVIVKHLEGKDIHTNIVIDPNASATPEKRERREARQARFPKAPVQDEEFGTFLESFV